MRWFARSLAALVAPLLAALLAMFAVTCSAATEEPYQLDKQYVLVNEQMPPSDPKKVLVQEFFWFGCPHCYHLEPFLNDWQKKKPAYVSFEHVPNSLGRPMGELHERAFYVAQVLGIEDKIHQPMFDGLKNAETGDPALTTPEDIEALFIKYGGIKPGDFASVSKSFAVDGDIHRADQLAMSYGVTSTPTIVVDGKWMTDTAKAGGPEALIKLIDFLCDKARKERGLK